MKAASIRAAVCLAILGAAITIDLAVCERMPGPRVFASADAGAP